jgi:hypothetical protein
MRLRVNDRSFEVASRDELSEVLAGFAQEEFREIWLNVPDFPTLSALVNRAGGWLIYMRHAGDAGLSSRNVNFGGNPDELAKYQLSNGQVDDYPASWGFPEADVFEALAYFLEHGSRPPFVAWHDDSA